MSSFLPLNFFFNAQYKHNLLKDPNPNGIYMQPKPLALHNILGKIPQTGNTEWPKMGKNSIISPFLA